MYSLSKSNYLIWIHMVFYVITNFGSNLIRGKWGDYIAKNKT